MHVIWGKFDEHAQKLKTGLKVLGPNFCADICYWCDGRTIRQFEHCSVCGKGRFYGTALGLIVWNGPHSVPASESVVNQVLVASERAANE